MKSAALAAILLLGIRATPDYNIDPCTHETVACWDWTADEGSEAENHWPYLGTYGAFDYYTIHPGETTTEIRVELRRGRGDDTEIRLLVLTSGPGSGKFYLTI